MDKYYQEYGSWEEAGKAWNRNPGGAGNDSDEAYENKLLLTKGTASSFLEEPKNKVINIVVIFKLLMVCLMFIFIGSKTQKAIIKHFGGMGFKLTQDE